MGHLGNLKVEHRDLLRRLDAGTVTLPEPTDPEAARAWEQLLELFYTPDEAALAARMPVRPASLSRIAARLGMDPEVLAPRLDALCNKGLVMDLAHPETGKTKYLLAPPVVGFFEFSMMRAHDEYPKKEVAAALDAYTKKDPAFAREVFGHDTVIGRALAHAESLSEEARPDVLSWESASAIVAEARRAAVSLCYCRHKASHLGEACAAPQEICLSLNAGADFVVRRGFGREIARDEAVDILEAARAAGLVHIADNVEQRPAYVCSCCGCCCGQLRSINDYDLPAVNPSGFEPAVDDGACRGCSRCSRACPVAAIAMAPRRVESQLKNELRPSFDADRCIGCGVCAEACTRRALRMSRRRVRPHVPRNAIERSVRMALERGRLAHLLFDEGESRGARFLNHALMALTRLPYADRLLASEQVRSRFVRVALARIEDPGA